MMRAPWLHRPVDALEDVERGALGGRRVAGEGVHGEQPRGRRGPEQPLVRGDRARHAGAVRVRLFRRADRAEALRHHALEVGMRGVDFRIDHRDRDIGAADHAVDVGDLELLEDVLRGVALLAGVAARGRRWIGRLLLQVVDVVRLHDRGDAGHSRARGWPPAGVLPLVMRKRTTVEPVLVRLSDAMHRQAEPATAACSRSTVMLLAICTTTSSLIKRVSVGGGMSKIRRSKPDGSCCWPRAGGVEGGCCGGSRTPPWRLLTTGAVLSAASWTVLVRSEHLRLLRLCCADSEGRNSGENG